VNQLVTEENVNLFNKKLKYVYDAIKQFEDNHGRYPFFIIIRSIYTLKENITNDKLRIEFTRRGCDDSEILQTLSYISTDHSSLSHSIELLLYFDNIDMYCNITRDYHEDHNDADFYGEILHSINV